MLPALLLAAAALDLADAAGSRPTLRARRIDSAPLLDGQLDDEVWQLVPATDHFTQKLPVAGAASEVTRLRVAFDAEALYVAFDCVQEKTPISSSASRRDQHGFADSVSFSVGSRADGRSAFEFGVSAAGVLTDGLYYDDTQYSVEWDETWQAKVARTEHGWSAEFRVPLRVLRFDPSAQPRWDFQARRFIAALQEQIEWSYIPRDTGGEVSQYGSLLGVAEPARGPRWEVRPSIVGRVRHTGARPGSPAAFDSASSLGIDLELQASQSLTLDATLNPDFAQIEADEQVFNLGNSESFFPEKRPFFLEGAEVWSTPLTLVYTRRIGLLPEPPDALGAAEFGDYLVHPAEPVRIYGATKLSGTIGKDWTIGLLEAVTAPTDLAVAWNDGRRARHRAEPTSAFAVLRLRRDLPNGSSVGTTLSAVKRLEPDAGIARTSNDAYVTSLDYRWRSADGEWLTTGQVIASRLANGPLRQVPDGTLIRPGDLGQGVFAQLVKQSGSFVGDLNFEYASRELDYTDLGYSLRSNLYSWSANLEFRTPRPSGLLLESNFRLEYLASFNLDGIDVGSTYRLGTHGKFSNLCEYAFYLLYYPRYHDDRETGDGLALERAERAGVELSLATDRSRRLSLGLSTLSQWIETGAYFEGQAELALRPWPELSVELGPRFSYTLGEPRFAADDPSERHIFGRLRAESLSALLRASYVFSPELTLTAYAQLFLASGAYSSLSYRDSAASGARIEIDQLRPLEVPLEQDPGFADGSLDLNLTLYWQYTPGSTLYVVYQHARSLASSGTVQPGTLDMAALGEAPAQDTLSLKLSLWWGN